MTACTLGIKPIVPGAVSVIVIVLNMLCSAGMLRRSDIHLLHVATGLCAGAGAKDTGKTNNPIDHRFSGFSGAQVLETNDLYKLTRMRRVSRSP